MRTILTMLGLLRLLSSGVARADTFSWSYSAGAYQGNGQLTTTALSGAKL